MAISVGDKIPPVTIKTMADGKMKDISTDEIFSGKKVVMFAVPRIPTEDSIDAANSAPSTVIVASVAGVNLTGLSSRRRGFRDASSCPPRGCDRAPRVPRARARARSL